MTDDALSSAEAAGVTVIAPPMTWEQARLAAHQAAAALRRPAVELALGSADGTTLAEPLRTRTDLPAFPTSSVDGWATRGPGPWRTVGRVLAGTRAEPLTADGTCVEIATGAMVPAGADQIVRVEDAVVSGGLVTGQARNTCEWRVAGEEAPAGTELFGAGTPVTPGLVGLAASCGYDTLRVWPAPRAALLVFGDELLTSGLPGDGRVRDALGPSVPAWLRRLGATLREPTGPVEDTLDAHVAALRAVLAEGVEMICTTGGTMHGPVDHLHPALHELGADYVVNTVEVRPGFPMLLAKVGGTLVAGLPGNPQSAIVALVSLVAPALAGLTGRAVPQLPRIRLGAPVPGRGRYTHLALVDRAGRPVAHVGSAMLRGLAASVGFAVIPPGGDGREGDEVALVPLPLFDGELP
jgi:molybdopterin molybdotransferase